MDDDVIRIPITFEAIAGETEGVMMQCVNTPHQGIAHYSVRIVITHDDGTQAVLHAPSQLALIEEDDTMTYTDTDRLDFLEAQGIKGVNGLKGWLIKGSRCYGKRLIQSPRMDAKPTAREALDDAMRKAGWKHGSESDD